MDQALLDIIKQKQFRMTVARRRLFEILVHADAPLSTSAIAKKCPTVDRVSVYRNLDLFTDLGITKTVMTGWKQHYELADPFRRHHHHLNCIKCGMVIDVESDEFEIMVSRIAESYGFQSVDHTLEIKGTCTNCRDYRD